MMSRSTAEQYSKPNRKTPVITKVTYAEIDVENRIWWTTDGNVHTSKPWNSEWTWSSPLIAQRWGNPLQTRMEEPRVTANAYYLLIQLVTFTWMFLSLLDMHKSFFRSSIGRGISGKQHVTSTDICNFHSNLLSMALTLFPTLWCQHDQSPTMLLNQVHV